MYRFASCTSFFNNKATTDFIKLIIAKTNLDANNPRQFGLAVVWCVWSALCGGETIDVTLWHLSPILPHITLDLHQQRGHIWGLDKCSAVQENARKKQDADLMHREGC